MNMPGSATKSGLDEFIDYVSQEAVLAPPGWTGAAWFILRIGDTCANIRLQDIAVPVRFLRQMAGVPPLRFDPSGFRKDLVDDHLPARHYVAFVSVGFWLPGWLALAVLIAWEVAGFFRYGGVWSPGDFASGLTGIRHGRLVARHGPAILPGLIAAELAESSA